MSTYIPIEVRRLVVEADGVLCVYCQISEDTTGQASTMDHIVPVAKGGESTFSNRCRACRCCNENKRDQTEAIDPFTGDTVALFHPRQQHWHDHFRWDQAGICVVGLTATGRATIVALDMNNELILFARRRWVNAGWHPPSR